MATRKLEVQILGDASSLHRAFGTAGKSASGFGSSLGRVAKIGALAAGAAGVGGLFAVMRAGIPEFVQAAKVGAQTEAVIKSTGKAANVTAKQVDALATSIMNKSGIDDEAVKSGSNMLLTFTNIRNEVGKGNDIFDQTTMALANMSTAMTGGNVTAESMRKQAIQLGKAMNDPVKGMTALRRVGVQFTDAQTKAVAAMVKAGDTMGAQKLILAELNKEFGGSAEAMGETLPGQINILKENFNNLAGTLVGVLAPALAKVVKKLTGFVTKFSEAKGIRAKLSIAWTGVAQVGESVGAAIVAAVRHAIAGEWVKSKFELPSGKTIEINSFKKGLAQSISDAMMATDWSAVGKSIVDGIIAAIRGTGEMAKTLADVIFQAARQVNWAEVGKVMGPGLAQAVVTAIKTALDPAFWAKNWDVALAIALTAFGGPVTKLGAALVGPLVRVMSKVWNEAILEVAIVIGRVVPKWGDAILVYLAKLPGLMMAKLTGLPALIGGLFGRLEKLATFTVKVLGLQVAINAIARFATDVYNKLRDLATNALSWASTIGSNIGSGIASGIRWAKDLVLDAVEYLLGLIPKWARKLMGISSPSTVMAQQVGVPLAQGLIQGWITGSAELPAKLSETLSRAIEAARTTIEAKRSVFSDAWSTLAGYALSAFDAKMATIPTKAEKALKKLTEAHDKAQAAASLASAKTDLSAARTAVVTAAPQEGETPEDFAQRVKDLNQAAYAAQATYNELLYQQQVTALTKRATEERVQRDALNAENRRDLELKLTNLGVNLGKRGVVAAKATELVLALLRGYRVDFKTVGAQAGNAFVAGLKEALEEAATKAGALKGTIEKQAASLKPKEFATGGIVTRRTLAMIGERGPEAIIPLGRFPGLSLRTPAAANATASGVGGSPINITVNGWVGNDQDIASRIRDELVRAGRRNTSIFSGPGVAV